MIVQTVRFPETPDATLEKIKELRPLLNKFYQELGKGDSEPMTAEMLTIMWHSFMLDFVEALNDKGERVGLLAVNVIYNESTGKTTGSISVSYVEKEYRRQGIFKRMIDHAKATLIARRVESLEVTVPFNFDMDLGEVKTKTYLMEL